MMLMTEEYNKKYTILLLFILLFPTKNFFLYFSIISMLFILCLDYSKIQINTLSKFFVIFIFYIFLTAGIRFFMTFTPNIRDFLESFRFVPTLFIFLSIYRWRRIQFENYIDASFIYVILDGIVSFMQSKSVNFLSILDLVRKIYNSDNHYEISLQLSNRTLGLSSGPGQHGSLICLLLIILLTAFFIHHKRKIITFLGTIIAFLIIVSSQSRTVLVATIVVVTLVVFFYLIRGNFKQRILSIIMFCLITISIPFIVVYLENFHYLFTLFVYGTNIHSYTAREEKWLKFINLIFEKPEWLLIGHGKDFFGSDSGAMDSDYVYIYSVYGFLILLIIITVILSYLINTLKQWKYSSPFRQALFFVIIGGIIISYTSAFFTDPKILIIISLLICQIPLVDVEKNSCSAKHYIR